MAIAVLPWVAAIAATVTVFGMPAQSGHDLFQQALVKERAEGNLQEAIDLYDRIVRGFPGDHALAAKALVQMGQCYEKLGKAGAEKAYERVIREYADQAEPLQVARTRLAALTRPSPPGMTVRKVWADAMTDADGEISPDGRYLSFVDWETGDLAVRDLTTGRTAGSRTRDRGRTPRRSLSTPGGLPTAPRSPTTGMPEPTTGATSCGSSTSRTHSRVFFITPARSRVRSWSTGLRTDGRSSSLSVRLEEVPAACRGLGCGRQGEAHQELGQPIPMGRVYRLLSRRSLHPLLPAIEQGQRLGGCVRRLLGRADRDTSRGSPLQRRGRRLEPGREMGPLRQRSDRHPRSVDASGEVRPAVRRAAAREVRNGADRVTGIRQRRALLLRNVVPSPRHLHRDAGPDHGTCPVRPVPSHPAVSGLERVAVLLKRRISRGLRVGAWFPDGPASPVQRPLHPLARERRRARVCDGLSAAGRPPILPRRKDGVRGGMGCRGRHGHLQGEYDNRRVLSCRGGGGRFTLLRTRGDPGRGGPLLRAPR